MPQNLKDTFRRHCCVKRPIATRPGPTRWKKTDWHRLNDIKHYSRPEGSYFTSLKTLMVNAVRPSVSLLHTRGVFNFEYLRGSRFRSLRNRGICVVLHYACCGWKPPLLFSRRGTDAAVWQAPSASGSSLGLSSLFLVAFFIDMSWCLHTYFPILSVSFLTIKFTTVTHKSCRDISSISNHMFCHFF